MKNRIMFITILFSFLISTFVFISCSNTSNIINQILSNEVSAKDRLSSAISQASTNYPGSKLVLIFGKNVKSDGKTDISTITAITSPDSIGAWLYVFRNPTDSSLKVYTPNPIPGTSNCLELTALFNINTVLGLITDTSAKNIVSGALGLITNANVSITTSPSLLIDSDSSLYLANNTNPIIKFNSQFIPSPSSDNGNSFFSTGTNQTRNMFLIPTVGTLNLPNWITSLTGFPPDLWVVNYKMTDASNNTQNLILGTVVQSGQIMGILNFTVTSRVINLSKFAN